jgi:hypothetical protein
MNYLSGEEMKKGDNILLYGDPGEVEFVVDGMTGDPEMDWHMETSGRGVMLIVPKSFGRVYIHHPETDERLVFVSRQGEKPASE